MQSEIERGLLLVVVADLGLAACDGEGAQTPEPDRVALEGAPVRAGGREVRGRRSIGYIGVLALLTAALTGLGCGDRRATEAIAGDEAAGFTTAALDTTLKETTFSNINGFDQAQYYATIQYPDVNGDSLSDVCGRGSGGVWCAKDDGTGNMSPATQWNTTFSNPTWSSPQYYSTIQFANVDGDALHRPDLCGRGPNGVLCGLSNGTSFATPTVWRADFNDTNGFDQAQYYTTIHFPDVNNDGKADVCGRGVLGIYCGLSTGSTFGALSLWSADFSNPSWSAPEYYSTIRFTDVSGDGKADVCGRGPAGIWCAVSTGTAFGPATLWQSSFTDAAGWTAPQYNSTIQFTDVNGDGKDDVCAHGVAGIICALSSGSSFGAVTTWQAQFGDPSWNNAEYYSTIHVQKGVLCARGSAGLLCAFSNGASAFTPWTAIESRNESDVNGWTLPQYYKTIGLTPDFKLMDRGAAGIYTTPVFPPDRVTLTSVGSVTTRRSALISKVWGRSSVETTQGIDGSPGTVDVSPYPAGTTGKRYTFDMPTSGGLIPLVAGGSVASVKGIADHFTPPGGSTKLVVINPGHACAYDASPYQDRQTVFDLLSAGWSVLATYMPLENPLQCTGAHDSLFAPTGNFRPAGGAHPLIYFLDPVRRTLNYALSHNTYNQVYMTGLSGGGWTTLLYAALDTRITTSVPVAGGAPFYMRPQSDAEQEDYVNGGNDFFNFTAGGITYKTGYKDLFVLGAQGAGRKQVQVLNRNDDCCFGQNEFKGVPSLWGQAVRNYEGEVRSAVQGLGAGSFRVEINEADDPGFLKHEFSRNTRNSVILGELDGGSHALGVGNGTTPFARGMNGHLMRYTGSIWSDSGLNMVGTPSVVTGAIAGHTYDVFFRDPSNRPVHAYFNGSAWTATSDIGGVIINDPVAVSWGAGRIDVVALGTDYNVYHWRYNGSWAAELVTTGQGVGPMALTAPAANRLDIYYRGLGGNLLHVSSNGGPPFSLENTGLFLRNFPAAAAVTGTQWAYYVGTDDRLYEAKQIGGGAWTSISLSVATSTTGTKVLGSPSVYRDASGNVKVYARIAGNQVGVFSFNGSTWSFSNPGGVARVGSPAANSLGAFILDPANQSAAQLDAGGWHALGGAFER
jgi:hypothetical protein